MLSINSAMLYLLCQRVEAHLIENNFNKKKTLKM